MAKPFRLTMPHAPEDELHQAVYDALRVLLPGDAVVTTWELRNAASAVEGARRKRLGAQAGWPDMGVFHQGRVVLLELKTEVGRASSAQVVTHARLRIAGFPVTLCRTVEHAMIAVLAGGIPLRGRVTA